MSQTHYNYREGRVVDPKTGDTDGRHRKWAESFTLNAPEDIKNLPWVGNHYSDNELFHLCNRFILKQTDREVQKQALQLMGKYAMGLKDEVTDEVLDQFLLAADKHNRPTPIIPNATEFQTQTIAEIEKRPEFDFWVNHTDTSEYGRNRPVGLFCIMWYDKQNNLRMTKIGVDRILREIVTK